MEAVKSAARRGRVRGIDATRGAAMLFVCLAHFGYAYFGLNGADRTGWIVLTIARIASPTFMLISGIVLGILYAFHREDFSSLRDRLIPAGPLNLQALPGEQSLVVGHELGQTLERGGCFQH